MFFTYLVLPFLALIPIGIYIYFYILRTLNFWLAKRNDKRIKIVSGFAAFFLSFCSLNLFGFGALVVAHMVAAALCMELLNFLVIALHKHRGIKTVQWNKIFSCGMIPVISTVLILGYGYYNMGNVHEKDYTIHTDKPIRSQGYRIAMIADLHFGTTMNEEKLKKLCNEIEGKKPDLVALCGDIVDESTTAVQMGNAARILGSIKSSYGTFYVYGNHDKATYSSKPNFNVGQLKNELESNKINVLEDEIYSVNGEFTIIGRKDKGFSSGIKRKTCKELLGNLYIDQNFVLLLDHQPSGLKENSISGIDLQLSGHTHGGQIWPVGLISNILGFGELNYGYEKIGKYQVIVTSGMAGWGYPIRTGSHSEYVIVDVKR